MKKAIVGKKIGMTQIFTEDGRLVPVTVIEAGPCTVVQTKTVETDGYTAVQVGFGEMTEKRAEKLHTKAELGHYKKAGVEAKRVLREFRFDDCTGYKVGDVITLRERSKEQANFKALREGTGVVTPKWLTFDAQNLTGTVAAMPAREDIDFQEHLIVELYSR